MTFPDFFQAIYPILGKGKSISEFARHIFDQLLDTSDSPDYVNPLYNVQPATIRRYVDPKDEKHNLPKKAVSGMRDMIEPAMFATYVSSFKDETLIDLAKKLKPEIPDVTHFNVGDRCADLFKSILMDIVDPPRKEAQLTLFEYMPPTVPADVASQYGVRLMLEAGSICPRKGCIVSLNMVSDSGASMPNYEVALIDSDKPPEYENLIALCPSCSKRYSALRSDIEHPAPYIRQREELSNKKREMLSGEAGDSVLPRYEIEKGVDRLLRSIQSGLVELSDEELEKLKLNYDPVKVRQKLRADTQSEKLFLKKILSRVISYYNLVDECLVNLNKERIVRQRMFSLQIKTLFYDLNDQMLEANGASQEEIYNKLVEWLCEKTGEDVDICRIVIAYFIQSCEVFDVISE